MAAAKTAPASAIDLKTPATFPVRLGASILKSGESTQLACVRYNRAPRLGSGSRASIEKSGSTDLVLKLKDGEGQYEYAGKNLEDGNRYVLLSRGNGKDREMVLERVQSYHELNLTRTPTEKDAKKLAIRYPHFRAAAGEEEEEDLFGDADSEETLPDPENPYDYRHYVKTADSKTFATSHPRPPNSAPLSQPSRRTDSSATSQPQKKRRAPEKLPSNPPKRVKAGTEPPMPASASSSKSKPKPSIPNIRMDRKASLQLGSFDDFSDDLILENATPVSEKPPKVNAMALALSGQLGQAPISLHSAANSPATRPVGAQPQDIEVGGGQEYEFEMGGESSPRQESDDEADADVEELELPSPAQPTRPKSPVSSHVAASAEEEDDLGKQLALAMAETDDGDVDLPPAQAPAESDEESEEE